MSFIQIPIQIYPNTSLGYSSLSVLTSGSSNTAVGYESLKSVTSGFENVAVGNLSLRQITTGAGNTAVGNLAISTGSGINNSTAVGAEAMRLSISGANNNTAIGNSALRNTLTGAQNTAVGYSAGYLISTGSKNTILGAYNGNQGGLDIRTANNYCVISDGDGNPRIIVDPTGLVSAPGGFSGGGGGGALTFNNQTAAYTVVSGDLGKVINCTANTFTVSLTAAATLGAGFNCFVWNTGTGVITIDPNGSETIDGVSTLTLRKGEGTQIVCNGTNWETGNKKTMRGYAENLPAGAVRPSAQGDQSVAILNSASANNIGCIAIGVAATATNNWACAIGNNSGNGGSQALSNGAMALNGSYSSGTDSFSASIANNTGLYGANGTNSVAVGQNSRAQSTGSYCFSGGIASGPYSFAIGGGAAGNSSLTLSPNGGASATAFSSYAMGAGGLSSVTGKLAFGYSANGQAGYFPMIRTTTDATATPLTTDGSAAGSLNQIILPNNAAHAFHGTIVARQQASGGTQSAAWRIEGLIRREANAASTTLVASTVTVISNAPGWGLALSADTTNGGLTITATGAVGTNIRWAANINTSESTYA